MHRLTLALVATFLLTAGLAAQPMAGSYSIPGTFKDFTTAAAALTSRGVSAPVTFIIVPGTYQESFTLGHVQGASATNTITFRSILPQMVKLQGTSGPTITFAQGTASTRTAWFVLDGLEFTGGVDTAITGNQYCSDIEIRNCTFLAAHGTSQTGSNKRLIYVNGNNYCERWNFHHNRVTVIQGCTYGIYLSQIKLWQIHHNEVDVNNARRGFYFINLNDAQNKFYNNLIWGNCSGSTSEAAVHMAASNYHNLVAHNTFLINTSTSNAFYTMGTTTRPNNIYGNIFMVVGGGTCLKAYPSSSNAHFIADGNLYWAPGGNVGNVNNTPYATLAAWQAASGQDGKSKSGDPLFVKSTATPYDLRIRPNSPAKDSAVVFTGHGTMPAFPIPDDYAGNLRDAKPDMGAYELTNFRLFGAACAGTGNKIPLLGYTGSSLIGSTSFTVTLAEALGSTGTYLAIGSSNQSWGPISLPFPLGGGCDLNIRITLGVPTQATGQGTASVPLPIPNDPALGGASFYLQWLVLDPGSGSGYGVVTTKGGAVTL